ncbi:MAG: UvrD-helicase domain-containing protein [Spirochaetales bacterium]|uniref:DNA 3'-5' helicase n=1 Tax=Candidatus Thalassospirochaeta sargassi TaxID=3119039 RepID=A0AAJ1IFK1_9SPIO|nr:UvrD-helicase domain-containing protein [Spirochaetales bacterium]
MRLDKFQQTVIDCDTNAVVSAGAGSGKTTVLSARFLRLIAERKAEVGEILTLTFTRKAAAEMYERIYSLLVENRDNPAVADAVADFDKASISTLDSFCSRIARDCSSLFGLPSNFTTDESSVRALAEDTSLDFILANAENPHLKDFIFINGFENVWKNFFVHIALNYLAIGEPVDFEEVFRHQMDTAEKAMAESAETADSLISDILAVEPVLGSLAKEQDKLASLPSIRGLSADSDYKGLLEALHGLNIKKAGGSSKKEEVLIFKDLVEELRGCRDELHELVGTLLNRRLIQGLFELSSLFQDEIFSRKRSSGLLGFHDVLTIAVSGLKRDHELRRYYKGLFRYIMIDEFQDNNKLQKELLYLLSERDDHEGEGVPAAGELNPAKLFFVGDEKQSIYRFRGADVSVFKQLSTEIGDAGGKALELKMNYRSEPGLIDFFNRLFSEVMSDSSEDYQASFEPLLSRPAVLPQEPDIRLLYKAHSSDLPEDSLSSEESEARAIAEYILSAEDSFDIAVKGEIRKARFSDFALLFRSGTNQKTYEQVFRAYGIPYNVHSVRSLFQEAPVNDIYNFLQLCLYPGDRTAAAALLRSPLMNLSDFSTVNFLLSGKKIFDKGFQKILEGCCRTEEDLSRYRMARGLYEEINPRIDREPLADIISDIWYKTGYRYLILADSSRHGYLEYFDYLKQLAVRYDQEGKSAADFLDFIRENLGEYKKIDDLKILGYSSGGVEIMPVHQSKGLEFPIVIVANAGNVGLSDRGGSTPAYISEADGLSFNLVSGRGAGSSGRCNYFFSRGKEENRAREEAELRRLLYVALTRAECHLVVSGCHGPQNRSGQKSMLNMFLSAFGWSDQNDPYMYQQLEPYIEEIKNRRWSEDGGLRGEKANIPAVSAEYSAAVASVYELEANEFSATTLNALHKETMPEVPDEKKQELPSLEPRLEKILSDKGLEADFGTICHRLIEWAVKSGIEESLPPLDRVSDELRPFFSGFSDNDWSLMVKSAAGLAEGFLKSETWKTALSSTGFESELAFTSKTIHGEDEVYVNGVIDLVFEMDDYIQIIDFKTDRKIIPGEYERQMELYIEAASEIYEKPARCSLFYLRSGVEISL